MKKNTKFKLVSSVLVLALCVTAFFGSTYAWFTDSVTSSGNKIQAGTLKLDLLVKNDAGEFESIKESKKPIFNYDKWEPGYTHMTFLKVENEGNLALKWKAKLVTAQDLGVLADVIDVYVAPGMSGYNTANGRDFTTGTTFVRKGTLREFAGSIESILTETLEPAGAADEKDAYYFGIAFKMPEEIGNTYTYSDGTVANVQGASLDAFDIVIEAAQLTYEEDSFNDQYDENAKYPNEPDFVVNSQTTSADINGYFAEGGVIYVEESVDLTALTDFSDDKKSIVINEDIILDIADGAEITFGKTTLFKGKGTLTINGGALKTNHELCITGDATLIIEDGEHTFGAFSATGNGSIIVNGGTLNCKGTYAGVLGISFAETGSLIVNDGILNMYQPFNLNANRCDNAYVEINGGEITLLNDADKLFAVRNIMDKDRVSGVLRGSSIKITGGTFTATYPLDSSGDANAFIRNEDSPCDSNRVLVSNVADEYNCVVTGGTFIGDWKRTGEAEKSGIAVVENTIAGFIADGYQITGDAVNGYVVSKN